MVLEEFREKTGGGGAYLSYFIVLKEEGGNQKFAHYKIPVFRLILLKIFSQKDQHITH